MVANINPQDALLVEKYSLPVRPSVYSEAAGKNVPISQDMEAFIITAAQNTRSSVLQWTRTSNEINTRNQDRDNLLGECLSQDLQNAQAQLTEADNLLKSYDTFQSGFFNSVFSSDTGNVAGLSRAVRYGDVPEVGQCLAGLSFSMDELLVIRDRALHISSLSQVLQERQRASALTDGKQQEIKTWGVPFGKYNNGAE